MAYSSLQRPVTEDVVQATRVTSRSERSAPYADGLLNVSVDHSADRFW